MKCWKCGTELEETTTDFEAKGVLIRGVRSLRCPNDGEELFTMKQLAEIKRRLNDIVSPLRLRRKVTSAGKRPTIHLPEDVARATNVKIGDEVEIYTDGRRIIIEPITPE